MSAHSLREIKPTDATWIFEACQDEQIQYWTTVPKPYLMEHAVGFANGQTIAKKVWVIEDSTKKEVGVISIHGVDENGNAEASSGRRSASRSPRRSPAREARDWEGETGGDWGSAKAEDFGQ